MRFGNDAALMTHYAVVNRAAGITIGAPCWYYRNRFARRCGWTHQAIEFTVIGSIKMQVRLEQVFVKVTRHQPCFVITGCITASLITITIKKVFPLFYLLCCKRWWLLIFRHRSTLCQPVHQCGVFFSAQIWQCIRHAALWMFGCIFVKLIQCRTKLLAIKANIEIITKHASACLWVQTFLSQHAIHHRAFQVLNRIAITFIQYRIKTFRSPFFGCHRVDKQTRRLISRKTRFIVNSLFTGPAKNAFRGRQL